MYKGKNLIKNTHFKLHNIHQRRGILRHLLNVQNRDLTENGKGFQSLAIHFRGLTEFLIHVISS